MIVIFGLAGHAQEVASFAEEVHAAGGPDLRPDAFVSTDADALAPPAWCERPVLGESSYWAGGSCPRDRILIAIGDPQIRSRVCARIRAHGGHDFPALVHPSVLMDPRKGAVRIGEGVLLFPGAIVTTDVTLGPFVHVNVGCSISHNTTVEDYATLSPGVRLCGNVRVGARAFLGCNAVVIERRAVAADAVVGAGAVVTRTLEVPGTYVGVPARPIRGAGPSSAGGA